MKTHTIMLNNSLATSTTVEAVYQMTQTLPAPPILKSEEHSSSIHAHGSAANPGLWLEIALHAHAADGEAGCSHPCHGQQHETMDFC